MAEPRLGAIILAAGFSSRMGAFKPLLQIEGRTFLEHAVGLFRQAGVEEIVTVLGHRAEELIPVLRAWEVDCVFNDAYRQGMFSSVRTGVAHRNPAWEAFFILPVDIPLVRPETVRDLGRAFSRAPTAPLCYPCHQARRGHPPLLNRRLAESILAYRGPDGLRGLLRRYEKQAVEIAVDDPCIHLDADVQQDLEALRETARRDDRRGTNRAADATRE